MHTIIVENSKKKLLKKVKRKFFRIIHKYAHIMRIILLFVTNPFLFSD